MKISRVRNRSVTLSLILAFALTTACKTSSVVTKPGTVRDDKLIAVALACKDITAAVDFGVKVKRALLADGKITREVSAQLTTYLTRIENAVLALNKRAGEFDSFTTGKADLFRLFTALESARNDLVANGTIPSFTGMVAEIFTWLDKGLAVLKPLFV